MHNAAWDAFSTPLGVILPAVDAVLDDWWQTIKERRRSPHYC